MKTKNLIIVLAVLLAVVIIARYTTADKGKRSFNSDIVKIDTANVSAIKIYSRSFDHKEIIAENNNSYWTVKSEEGEYQADINSIKRLLGELALVKAKRKAAASDEKWVELEVVDTIGTRVVVEVDGEEASDFIIGKFNYQQGPQNSQGRTQTSSFIRLSDDKNVYAIDGMINMAFNIVPNSLRDKTVIRTNKEKLTSISFSYPADSSYSISNETGQWLVNGISADSANMEKYLQEVRNLYSSSIIQDADIEGREADFKIEFNSAGEIVEIKAFATPTDDEYIISTSLNKTANFSGKKEDLFKRLFVPESNFIALFN